MVIFHFQFHLLAMNSNPNLFIFCHGFPIRTQLSSHYHHQNAVVSPDLLCSQLANHCQSLVSLPPSCLKKKKKRNHNFMTVQVCTGLVKFTEL